MALGNTPIFNRLIYGGDYRSIRQARVYLRSGPQIGGGKIMHSMWNVMMELAERQKLQFSKLFSRLL